MKTRIASWSVLTLLFAVTLVGPASEVRAERPALEISLGRRLVRPATVVTPAVMPVVDHVYVHPGYSSLVPVGHPAYPYMLGVASPRRSVVVARTVYGGAIVGHPVVTHPVVTRPLYGRTVVGRTVVSRSIISSPRLVARVRIR